MLHVYSSESVLFKKLWIHLLECIKGIFILCVLSVPLSLSLSAGLFTGVSNGSQIFGLEEESQCFHYVLDDLQTLRITEWFESFNSMIQTKIS